jgi:HTH-type transcriptional repressor of NAD biosynthesis genes
MTTGLIIGKFLPPHRGHAHLIETARAQVDQLIVLVCSLKREEIPGERRVAWLGEMFPGVDVRHHADENPSEPHQHPGFWELWTASIKRLVPTPPDLVFSSEGYGDELARRLGARHVLVDRERRAVPISGERVRADPIGCWEFLPECVRPEYVRRIVVTGPESTGKTTLARRLAEHFATTWVPEFARAFLDEKHAGGTIPSPPCEAADIPRIAQGQLAAEERAARAANRLLVCDTDLYATRLYAEEYFGECPQWIRDAAGARRYDLHLLLDVDVPWVADPQRDRPQLRRELLARFSRALEDDRRPCVLVSGGWDERFERALAAVAECRSRRFLRSEP